MADGVLGQFPLRVFGPKDPSSSHLLRKFLLGSSLAKWEVAPQDLGMVPTPSMDLDGMLKLLRFSCLVLEF